MIWNETMCAVSASLRIEPGPLPKRRPKGGSEVAARRLKFLALRWSQGHQTVRKDGPLVIRLETTCAELCRCGPSRVRHHYVAP